MPKTPTHALASDIPLSQPALRLLRPGTAADLLGISLTTLWRLSSAPDFPKKYQLSANAVAWREADLDKWLSTRRAA